MRRVLLLWRKGDGSKYTFISRISEGYIIPQDTKDVYFIEGWLVGINITDLDSLIIEIPIRNELVIHYDDYTFKPR
jgi:hypothetical protein